MSETDIYCPSCGHHLFKADLRKLVAEPPRGDRSGAGTEAAAVMLSQFFAEQERIVSEPYSRLLQATVIEAVNAWLATRGVEPMSSSAIGRGLRALGFDVAKSQGQRYYRGLALTHIPD